MSALWPHDYVNKRSEPVVSFPLSPHPPVAEPVTDRHVCTLQFIRYMCCSTVSATSAILLLLGISASLSKYDCRKIDSCLFSVPDDAATTAAVVLVLQLLLFSADTVMYMYCTLILLLFQIPDEPPH